MFLLALTAHAATWYADPSLAAGQRNGATLSVEEAIGEQHPRTRGGRTWTSPVLPGDTVVFLPGAHDCRGNWGQTDRGPTVTNNCNILLQGAPGQPITLVADDAWTFTFLGGLVVNERSRYVTLERLHVENPDTVDRKATWTNYLPPGIDVYGDSVTLRHNLIENVGHPGIGEWKSADDKVVEGNIVRFVGMNDTKPSTVDSRWIRGSGLYLQNAATNGTALIGGNISYGNATAGLKAYGSGDNGNGPVAEVTFLDNITTDNSAYGGIFVHRREGELPDLTVAGNVVFEPRTAALTIGYPLGEDFDFHGAWIEANHAVGRAWGFALIQRWTDTFLVENVFTGLYDRVVRVGEAPDADVTLTWKDNEGRDGTVAWRTPRKVYEMGEVAMDLGTFAWTLSGAPGVWAGLWEGQVTGVEVSVIAPSADPDFAHVAVENVFGATTAWADLTGLFQPGDVLAVYDAQELPYAYATFAYTGGAIPLDLTRSGRLATRLDAAAAPWAGFDPSFDTFVIRRVPTGDVDPTATEAVAGGDGWEDAAGEVAGDELVSEEGSVEEGITADADPTAMDLWSAGDLDDDTLATWLGWEGDAADAAKVEE